MLYILPAISTCIFVYCVFVLFCEYIEPRLSTRTLDQHQLSLVYFKLVQSKSAYNLWPRTDVFGFYKLPAWVLLYTIHIIRCFGFFSLSKKEGDSKGANGKINMGISKNLNVLQKIDRRKRVDRILFFFCKWMSYIFVCGRVSYKQSQ